MKGHIGRRKLATGLRSELLSTSEIKTDIERRMAIKFFLFLQKVKGIN